MSEFLQCVHRLTEPQRRLLRLRLGGTACERGGEPRLVGYVVPHAHGSTTAQDLRGFLTERVPEYMVPSTWVFLSSFPLTSRGKVDRKALLELARTAQETESQSVSPRNDTQRAIAMIWKDLLGVPTVGRDDNFFDLGGHSLLLPKVLSKVRTLTRRQVSMVDLFRYPTVDALATHIAGDHGLVDEDAQVHQTKEKREAGVRRLKQQRQQRQLLTERN